MSPWDAGAWARLRWILACGGAGALLALPFGGGTRTTALLSGVGFSLFALAVVVYRGVRHQRRDLFSPLVMITGYLFVGIGIRGLTILVEMKSKLDGIVDPTSEEYASLITRVFLLSGAGLAALLAGDYLGGRHAVRRVPGTSVIPLSRLRGAMLAGTCCTLFACAVYVARIGPAAFLDPSAAITSGTYGLFWLFPLMYGALYGASLGICVQWVQGRQPHWTWGGALLLSGLVVYTLTSSKAVLIQVAVIPLLAWHYGRRPVRLWLLLVLAAGFFVALPILYLHRHYGFTLAMLQNLTPKVAMDGMGLFLGRSYLADSFGAILTYTPSVYPYRLGERWLELFYFWIPRGLWPGKPISSSVEFGETYLGSLATGSGSFYAPTLMGDAYMNFGALGVLGVMFVVGYLLRRWYDGTRNAGGGTGLFLYCCSAYWIAAATEQSLTVAATLALSYLGIAAMLNLLVVYPELLSRLKRADGADGHRLA